MLGDKYIIESEKDENVKIGRVCHEVHYKVMEPQLSLSYYKGNIPFRLELNAYNLI